MNMPSNYQQFVEILQHIAYRVLHILNNVLAVMCVTTDKKQDNVLSLLSAKPSPKLMLTWT